MVHRTSMQRILGQLVETLYETEMADGDDIAFSLTSVLHSFVTTAHGQPGVREELTRLSKIVLDGPPRT